MKNSKEELLIKVIHFLSEKFKEKLVLEGGMLLRMLGSPRSTQDVDYYLISNKSKKILEGEIGKVLDQFKEAKVTAINLNSRGIFIDMEGAVEGEGKIMIEICVIPSLNLPSEHISTVPLSSQYSLSGRIIATIALSEAFSHKIAACIERRSMRDLYDISVFEPLCDFDKNTLLKRFAKLSVGRQKPQKISFAAAAEILEKRAREISEDSLRDELYPLIPSSLQAGQAYMIKVLVMRVVQKLSLEFT